MSLDWAHSTNFVYALLKVFFVIDSECCCIHWHCNFTCCLFVLQDTNMMNQSMQSMYKATSSRQNSDDEGDFEQATDPSKSKEGKTFKRWIVRF